MFVCICFRLVLRDQSCCRGRKKGPGTVLQLQHLTVAPGCPCRHSQASFWCLCCWMMDLHEQTPFSGSSYAWSILNLLLFCWSWLLGDRVSLWSPGCLGTHCNPPASASRVLGLYSHGEPHPRQCSLLRSSCTCTKNIQKESTQVTNHLKGMQITL